RRDHRLDRDRVGVELLVDLVLDRGAHAEIATPERQQLDVKYSAIFQVPREHRRVLMQAAKPADRLNHGRGLDAGVARARRPGWAERCPHGPAALVPTRERQPAHPTAPPGTRLAPAMMRRSPPTSRARPPLCSARASW